ncbi:MAG: universal stress protein [Pseudomonadota bacterium]
MKNKPYTLLVGVDFSEQADRALHEAFAQASQRSDSEVHVLSVLPVASEDPSYAISVYATLDEKPLLDAAIQRLRGHVEFELERFRLAHPDARLGFRVLSHAHVDTAAHGIVQLASDLGADLILIGTHNPKGIERLLLGSVAEATVRNARCPVLVIPPPPNPATDVVLTPPCPECVRTRATSAGKEFWCEQHRERHGRRHTYHQSDRSGGESNFPLVFR